jgi:hypothetical protein
VPAAETGRPTAPSRRQPHDGCPVLPCAPLDFPCLPLYPPVAGYEHNYGHGEKNLAVVLALLMMLAFLIDQVQQRCNPLFRAAWEKKGPKCALWEAVRNLFASFEVSSMRDIYEALAYGYARPRLRPLVEQVLAGAGKETADTS